MLDQNLCFGVSVSDNRRRLEESSSDDQNDSTTDDKDLDDVDDSSPDDPHDQEIESSSDIRKPTPVDNALLRFKVLLRILWQEHRGKHYTQGPMGPNGNER